MNITDHRDRNELCRIIPIRTTVIINNRSIGFEAVIQSRG